MKSYKHILTFFIFFLLCKMAYSQLPASTTDCDYAYTDINLSLNGWDFSRTDYENSIFIQALGSTINVGSSPTINTTLDYSGEKDTAEFGYPWYYYKYGSNRIHFSGKLNANGVLTNEKQLFSFRIVTDDFNVNGIKVGDNISQVINSFNLICHDSFKSEYYLNYGYHSLSFFYNSQNNLIIRIEYNTPL